MPGSSPRPWGTHRRRAARQPLRRFIPTPVGNTISAMSQPVQMSVHPHARGEHPNVEFSGTPAAGSSPRPWGTLLHAHAAVGFGRFIPTPVGNTEWLDAEMLRRGGSSPRPWGTPVEQRHHVGAARFIPTPVGNTLFPPPSTWAPSVHPHARGEHLCDLGSAVLGAGSSPRPWGTRPRSWPGRQTNRFIPTPVGNTPTGC